MSENETENQKNDEIEAEETPAAEPPVRDSGPGEGASGEPGGSPGDEAVSEETQPETVSEPEAPVAPAAEADPPVEEASEEAPVEEPVAEAAAEAPQAEATVEEVEPAADVEAEAAAAEAPAEDAPPEEAPAEDAHAEEPPAEDAPEAEAAPPAIEPKRKKKRLPRPERRQRSKPKREKPAERKPIVRLEKPEHDRGRRQERRGVVVSDAMDKTIVVKVDTIRAHPRYKKVIRRSQKFHAHDAENRAKVGDLVRIIETRPLSKTKNWRLAEVVEAAR
jgi:small subunit ribosomal protein S17